MYFKETTCCASCETSNTGGLEYFERGLVVSGTEFIHVAQRSSRRALGLVPQAGPAA